MEKEMVDLLRLRPRGWVIVFTLVAALAAGCSFRSNSEFPAWETPAPSPTDPAPSPPDTALLNSGDAAKRPVFRRIEISHFDVQNGWHIVPSLNYKLMVEVEGAEEVYFQAFDPGAAPNPDKDGYLHSPKPSSVKHPGGDPDLWAIGGMSNGGQVDGFYAVAENQYGRTISPVLFVYWSRKDSGYSEQDLKEPY